ncbi:MAG: hypothetical protein WBP96_03590, partial [Nitrososphaeraceae archaeon]
TCTGCKGAPLRFLVGLLELSAGSGIRTLLFRLGVLHLMANMSCGEKLLSYEDYDGLLRSRICI